MSGAVQSEMIRCVAHSVNRFTIEIATTPQEFRAEYERVVPLVPIAEVRSLAARRGRRCSIANGDLARAGRSGPVHVRSTEQSIRELWESRDHLCPSHQGVRIGAGSSRRPVVHRAVSQVEARWRETTRLCRLGVPLVGAGAVGRRCVRQPASPA
jgi:hypothetical protein